MLHLDLWKRLVIWGLMALGLLFAMPNVFYNRVEGHNDAIAALEKGAAPSETLATAQAGWPEFLPSALVNLGLDLRGGAHLLAEVKLADVYADRMDNLWPEVRDTLRALRADVGNVRRQPSPPGSLRVQISDPDGIDKALTALRGLASPIVSLSGVGQNDLEINAQGQDLIITLSEAERTATDTRTLQQTLEIVRRRVDEVGTREPTIQRQGEDRVLIQVPGIGSAAELKALIGTTARLTFNPVVGRAASASDAAGPGNVIFPSVDEPGVFYRLEKTAVVTGEELVDAQPAFDQNGRPAVNFRFNPTGARKFGDYTAENIGSPFAIVLDDEVISAPVIQSHIPGGSGIITGRFSVEDSTKLAVLLRAGALPAGLSFLEERTIGPELGADSIAAGKIAAMIGFGAVMAYMIASYGLFGLFANIALFVNVALIFALLSAIGATLTLPGIAGIVLTMGMSVDANVLIFERIREELRAGRNPARAIEMGYEKALSAILDANITTLIIALIMFTMGSGPIRGFSVTLGIGLFTSVFTAIYVTRVFVLTWFNIKRPKKIAV